MTTPIQSAMVAELVALLETQPMTALGLTTIDHEEFWLLMVRVQQSLQKKVSS